MLKNSITMTEFIHPCFGKIRFDEKFTKVLELKPFQDLAHKSQLGTKIFSKKYLNAKHTRLMHSIGVYYLTSLLLKTCKAKFSNYLKISLQDEETLLLAALGHDVGHLPFSHSLEKRASQSHEEMTIELFKDYQHEINEIFGYDIVSKVIQIFQNNKIVKETCTNESINDENLDILFIFSSLLVGSIDCDRMEYITTDRYMTLGEKPDFRSVFDYITIVLLNNNPTVGFEKDAVPLIENLLTNRFEQYDQIYFDEDATLIEIALNEYVNNQNWTLDRATPLTEYRILSYLNEELNSCHRFCNPNYRLAQIILMGERKNILFRKFTSKSKFDFFMDKIRSIARDAFDSLWLKTSHKTNCIYNPNKNLIYIKDTNGVVKDITEVSHRITNLSIDYYYVMIDLDAPHDVIDSTIFKNLTALFNDNEVEIEKKFIPESNVKNFMDDNLFCNIVCSIPNLFIKKRSDFVVNDDQYYTPCINVPKGMAMRLRKTSTGSCYFIKLPSDDGTSITKRDEHPFPNCYSLDEFLGLAESLIKLKGYELDGNLTVVPGVHITTKRLKILVQVYESIVEIVYDMSTYEYNGITKNDFMIECELIHGDDLSLWYLAKYIKKFGFVETNESKETRAKTFCNLLK